MQTSTLALSEIHAHDQDRKSFDTAELEQLAANIERHGLAQPPTVRPCDEHGGHVIVAGERRYRAHLLLQERGVLTTMPVLIRDLSDEQASAIQLAENVQRSDLDPFEEAKAYRNRMTDFGMDEDGIAEFTGKPVAYIRKRLELLNLDEEWVGLVASGDLNVGFAGAMAKLDSNRQALAIAALRRSNGMTFWQFQEMCDRFFAEQQQDSMFDDSLFLKVDEYVADAKQSAVVTGRMMVQLVDELGEALSSILDHYDEGAYVRDQVVDAGVITEETLKMLLDKVEHVRRTRIEPKKAKAKPARGRTSRRAAAS